MSKIILSMIFGMALVTWLPRVLPVVLLDRMKFGAKIEKFLRLIPYTAMSALIFPGVFLVDAEHPMVGIAGGLAAGLLAWRKCPVMICVLTAIAVDFLIYLCLV